MDAAELKRAARPEAVLAALEVNADELVDPIDHHGGPATSVREVDHRGHHIVIRTTYAIEVDGRPFEAHVGVGNDGRVHYHGLPTRDFASMVDLVRKVIDQFPEDFDSVAPPDEGGGGGGHEHGGHGPGTGAPGGGHDHGPGEPAAGPDHGAARR